MDISIGQLEWSREDIVTVCIDESVCNKCTIECKIAQAVQCRVDKIDSPTLVQCSVAMPCRQQ